MKDLTLGQNILLFSGIVTTIISIIIIGCLLSIYLINRIIRNSSFKFEKYKNYLGYILVIVVLTSSLFFYLFSTLI